MAVDKLVDSTQLDTDLTSVANAIRTKGGTSAQLAFPAGFVSAIDAIPTGGGDPQEDLVKLNNNQLASFSNSDVTRIRTNMFRGATALKSINIPNVVVIKESAFYGSGLTGDVVIEKYLSTFESYVFRDCPMSTITFKGGIVRIDANTFEGCLQLTTIDIGNANASLGIRAERFYNTQNLSALVIRYTGGVIAASGGVFPSTCGLATSGYIYVPSDLVASYKAATNWSTYADRILPIEGSYYETHWANGEAIS